MGWSKVFALLLLGVGSSLWPGNAEGLVQTKVGSFSALTGNPPNGNQDITLLGFQPVAVIFFWTNQTMDGFADHAAVGYGFSAGPGSNRAVGFSSRHSIPNGTYTSTNPARMQRSDRCIFFTDPDGTLDGEAAVTAILADGFTVRWQPKGSLARIVHYIALGGPDITNAATGQFTPAAGTGSEPFAGVGFQPDFLMFLSIDSNTVASRVSDGKVSIGYAGRSYAYGITQGGLTAVSPTTPDASSIFTSGSQRTDAAILEKDFTVGATAPTFVGAVTSFDADGFTLDKMVNTAGTQTIVHYLALRGGQYRVRDIKRPATAGASTQTISGMGFTPRGLLFSSWNLVSQPYDEDARISFSAADNVFSGLPPRPSQRATFFHDKVDLPSDSDASQVAQATTGGSAPNGSVVFLAQAGDCYPNPAFWDPAGAAQCSGPARLTTAADVTMYYTDGFALNWTTNDLANLNQPAPSDEANADVLYMAFGDSYVPPPTVSTKVGSFVADQFTGTQSIINVGFQPKAVIFFWTRQETPGFVVNAAVGYGFATGAASERAVNYLTDDNILPGAAGGNNTSRWQWTNRCIVITNTSTAGTTSHEAQFVSMDAGGFTLNWTKATSGVNYTVHYLALGGAAITNAAVGTFRPGSGTGSEAVAGLAFQPDFLMFLSIDSNTAGARVNPDGKVSIGFAANGPTITQAALTVATRSGPAANVITSGASSDDAAILEKAQTVAQVTFEAAVTSFNANGFTINKTLNTAGTETDVQYLALRGGQYNVGWLTRSATQTPPSFPLSYTGTGFAPRGLLFMSWGHIRSILDPNVGDGEARISFGASDMNFSGTPPTPNQRATFFHDKTDAPADGDYTLVRQNISGQVGLNGKAVYLAQAASCPPNPLYHDPVDPGVSLQCDGMTRSVAEADVVSYDPGGFTLNWTINDTTNTNDWIGDEQFAQVFYVGVGNPSTTEVKLSTFEARPGDSVVHLEWETASELSNLGFHLYSARSEAGPYERITSSLIPGLGSSPVGGRYSYTDSGLTNGTRYYYQLEDVETTGRVERHGPVSAVPVAGATTGDPAGDPGTDPGADPGGGDSNPVESTRVTYGEPSSASLEVLRRDSTGVDLELVTGGFYATPEADGSMKLEVPGFELQGAPGTPAIPVERTFLEAVAGREVRIASVVPSEVMSFPWPRPALAQAPELLVGRDGTVKASFRRVRPAWVSRRPYPAEAARVVTTAFQGETKKALLELAPLRWNSSTGQLLLTRRLRVRVAFDGIAPGETPLGGSRGRALPRQGARGSRAAQGLVAHLLARDEGLYAVRFEDVFRRRLRAVPTHRLRLSRLGQDVPFHVEPDPSRFSPGSVLYFLSEGGSLSKYANEAVYELALGTRGTTMPTVSSPLAGTPVTEAVARRSWETNRYYIADLLEAPDPWLWDSIFSGLPRRSYPFGLSGLAASSTPATLSVWLQGATDFDASPDHHVRLYVNGSYVTESSWSGKTARQLEASLSPGLLHEGENSLEIENVADTAAAYSMIYLDRFSVDYPHTLTAESGRLEAAFTFPGSATIAGLGTGSLVVDKTGSDARWVVGSAADPTGLRFGAEAGHRYLTVSPEALLRPGIRSPSIGGSDLRRADNQADYLLVAPRELLPAAAPLLRLREEQGLRTRAVPLEEIDDAFGYGERSPEAIRDFIAYAYHRWAPPSPRYVLLLGDATLDPKNYAGTGVKDYLPAFMFKSTWLWTASDPAYASVNGEDSLPDLAVGRLPASSLEQAESLVHKLVAFEENGYDPAAPAVLVADNPDRAGHFEADADDIASGPLAGHPAEKIYLGRLGAEPTRSAVLAAFDRGASLVSYVGHGAPALWASERIFHSSDVARLSPQERQPLVLTMNCLNGYFLPMAYDSLAEALVKAEDKGAIAALAPSGLSLDDAAHLYHKALVTAVVSGRHARLGDAVLAAQRDYADTGAFPELLRVYQFFGDPALRIQ